MKYNPEMNRCRGVDPRLLGQMLGSDTPIDADYTPQNRRARTCGCGNRGNYSNRGVEGCGYGNRSNYSKRSVEGCSACTRNEDAITADGSLASACAGEPSLAMVYSPHQIFDGLFSTEEALEHGTLFVELDKPWKVGGCR